MNKAFFALSLAVATALLSAPAFAAVPVEPPANAPEPVTLALLATGLGAVAVARRFRRT